MTQPLRNQLCFPNSLSGDRMNYIGEAKALAAADQLFLRDGTIRLISSQPENKSTSEMYLMATESPIFVVWYLLKFLGNAASPTALIAEAVMVCILSLSLISH